MIAFYVLLHQTSSLACQMINPVNEKDGINFLWAVNVLRGDEIVTLEEGKSNLPSLFAGLEWLYEKVYGTTIPEDLTSQVEEKVGFAHTIMVLDTLDHDHGTRLVVVCSNSEYKFT